MKQRVFPLLLLSAVVLAPAWAQLSPQGSWDLGFNLNRVTAATEFGGSGTTATLGATDVNSSLQGAYSLALGTRYRLGLGLNLGLGEQMAGRMMLAGTELNFRLRDMYALYAEPGYQLGASTLLYGKLAYLGARGQENHGPSSFSKTYAGLGLGAGLRTMLGESLYLQVELLYGDYEWKSSLSGAFRPSTTAGSVGLGWRF